MKTFAGLALLSAVALAQSALDVFPMETNGDTSDSKRTFGEICAENGFDFEEHQVVTEDGYILTVYRIPGQIGEASSVKPPVLFQHGILDSANCWIVNYADVAPAFVASRAGYDVWLGNSRGNTYSRAHVEYDPDRNERKFWDFTWYDMGTYDLPAVIDYVQTETEGQKVAYVGHSQGTTQMFSALAENQDYFADKVPIFVALGPVSKISHTQSEIFQFASHFYDLLADTCSVLGIHELLGANWFTSGVSSLFCTNIPELCELIAELFVSKNPELDDNDRFAVYMGHEPNGSSVKSILHYAQNLKEDRFQVYADDYSDILFPHRETDLIPIENISAVPIAMFTGIEDILADLTDSRWTRDRIGDNIVHYEEIHAGHLTFLVGKDMTYFTEGVMGLLQEYHPVTPTEGSPSISGEEMEAFIN